MSYRVIKDFELGDASYTAGDKFTAKAVPGRLVNLGFIERDHGDDEKELADLIAAQAEAAKVELTKAVELADKEAAEAQAAKVELAKAEDVAKQARELADKEATEAEAAKVALSKVSVAEEKE